MLQKIDYYTVGTLDKELLIRSETPIVAPPKSTEILQ